MLSILSRSDAALLLPVRADEAGIETLSRKSRSIARAKQDGSEENSESAAFSTAFSPCRKKGASPLKALEPVRARL
jgi:hypothetical protein